VCCGPIWGDDDGLVAGIETTDRRTCRVRNVMKEPCDPNGACVGEHGKGCVMHSWRLGPRCAGISRTTARPCPFWRISDHYGFLDNLGGVRRDADRRHQVVRTSTGRQSALGRRVREGLAYGNRCRCKKAGAANRGPLTGPVAVPGACDVVRPILHLDRPQKTGSMLLPWSCFTTETNDK